MSIPEVDYHLLLNDIWQDCVNGNMRAVFLNTENSQSAHSLLNRWLQSKVDIPQLRTVFYDQMHAPYFPFLQWMQKLYKNKSSDELGKIFEDADVYYFQRHLFETYFIQNKAARQEPLLLDECTYEQNMMYSSLKNLIFTAGKIAIIVLENFHSAPLSTYDFLINLADDENAPPALFIFVMPPEFMQEDEEKSNKCIELRESMATQSIVLDLPDNIRSTSSTDLSSLPAAIPEQIRLAEHAFHFFAYDDCRRLIDSCLPGWLDARSGLERNMEYKIHQVIGDLAVQQGQLDEAHIQYTNLLNLAQEYNDLPMMASTLTRIGVVHLKKDDVETAENYASRSIKMAGNLKDIQIEFSALFLQFLIEDKGRKQNIAMWRESYERLLQLASTLQYENTISFLYTNAYAAYSFFDRDNETRHNIGIEIARRHNNQHRLAAAYQTRGLIHAVKGNYESVITYYELSRSIKEKIRDPLELAYINNGLGFYHYMTGNYAEAVSHYGKALEYLKIQREFHEIAQTLFNIAAALFLGMDYNNSIHFLEELFSLMRIMHFPNLAYHSLFGISTLLALAYYKAGNFSKAHEIAHRIKVRKLKPYPKKNEEFFFFYLLKSLLAENRQQHASAKRSLRVCRYLLSQTNDVISYMAPAYWHEAALYYTRSGEKVLLAEALEQGRTVSADMGFNTHERLFKKFKPDEALAFFDETSSLTFDFAWILEAARMEMNAIRMHKKIQQINFINAVQTLAGNNYRESRAFFQDVFDLFEKNFLIDRIYLHIYQNGSWRCSYCIPENAPELAPEFLPNLILDTKAKYYTRHSMFFSENPSDYTTMVSLPMVRDGRLFAHLLCANVGEKTGISREDVQVMSIAARQITNTLEKIEQQKEIMRKNEELSAYNRQLEETAATDMLTGTSNRFALHKRLNEEAIRLKRYHKNTEVFFSIVFIDLDNFKFYNDEFGHLLGDSLLVEFAAILKNVTRDSDFIARYGGDEFVLLLPETGAEGAKRTAARLLEDIAAKDFFRETIENFLGGPAVIPEDCRLSCSIGIAQYTSDLEGDVERMLQMADKALYNAKNQGKNCITVFNSEI